MEKVILKKSLRDVYTELFKEQEAKKSSGKKYKALNLSDKVEVEIIKDFRNLKSKTVLNTSLVAAEFYKRNGIAK